MDVLLQLLQLRLHVLPRCGRILGFRVEGLGFRVWGLGFRV